MEPSTTASSRPIPRLSLSAERTMRMAFRNYVRWCDAHHLAALPTESMPVERYLRHLDDADRTPRIIGQAQWAIKATHRQMGISVVPRMASPKECWKPQQSPWVGEAHRALRTKRYRDVDQARRYVLPRLDTGLGGSTRPRAD